jgi:hypothetical protein
MMLIIAVIALLVGVALLGELAARAWIRTRTRYRVWPPGMRLEVRQDPGVFPEVEPRVRIESNSDGERGGEVAADDPGVYRILVAGGSAAECYALDQPTSWPGELERLLNRGEALRALGVNAAGAAPPQRVHVGNIARSGVGAPELDRVLERVLPNYDHLDAIVVMVGASTCYHWLEDGAPASRPTPVVPDMGLFAHQPGQRFSWSPRGTALAELARRLRQTWFRPLEVKENVGNWLVAGRRMRATAKELRTAVPDPAVVLEQFEVHLRSALLRAMKCATRVLVVRQPWFEKDYTPEESARFWHGGVGKPWKETVSVYFSLDVINRLLSLIDARVVAVAEDLGLRHVNLRPVLNQGLRHFYDHDHFTPEGAAVAARTIAAALTGTERPARRDPRLTQPRIPLAAR